MSLAAQKIRTAAERARAAARKGPPLFTGTIPAGTVMQPLQRHIAEGVRKARGGRKRTVKKEE